ncbi:MerR family transcriptional regulator [Pelagibacterales bacterium SAG-MED41]|nr:MerR family transcriptional regulator [Pelagibacterales bacterium SAG-MED41]|tara:strand:+ start:796 stop:1194 length:399 start_codon:yes stop_codon:yes gene_type:complete
MSKFLTISEISKNLNLVNSLTNKPSNHIIRYWEKEFKQIKPKKINNRRYYSPEQAQIIKIIKFLLRDKGMTISGVKDLLKYKINNLDVYNEYSLKADQYKDILKIKSRSLQEKVKKLKNYGKKNSSKSTIGS